MTVRNLGKKFKNLSANLQNLPLALIAPSDNPNGLILRSLRATTSTLVISAIQPPVSARETDYLIIHESRTEYDDLLVPAGNGVFAFHRNQYSNVIKMSWDLLNADGTTE